MEQLASLRGNAEDHPTILVLTRQKLSVLLKTKEIARKFVQKGETPEGILIAIGSEVHLALEA